MSKQQRKKKKWLIALIICLPILIIIGVYSYYLTHNQEVETIAYINDEPISVEEFNLFFARERAQVFSYFHSTYTISEKDDFWHTEYEGQVPIKVAREKTLEALKRIKIEQLYMKEEGILEDTSYGRFLEDLATENERRKKALENNQVIYGPKEFRENTYYDYLHSNRVIALKDKLGENGNAITDDELRKYYEDNKKMYPDYKKQDYIKTHMVAIPYIKEGKEIMKQEKASALIQKAKKDLVSLSFEDVMTKYNQDEKLIERVFDETTARQDIKYESELYTPISMLQVGQVSEVIEFSGTFYIVMCMERRDEGYHDFDGLREVIYKRYIDQLYEEHINQRMADVKVNTVDKVYQNFEPK